MLVCLVQTFTRFFCFSCQKNNTYDLNNGKTTEQTTTTHIFRPLSNSKSSDWTEVSLEVPEKEEVVHRKNPNLSAIFNNNDGTPTPPPRKHKKGIREKIESVARSGLQALQSKKPVEEPPFVKKTYNYGCPMDDHDHKHHNRLHKHEETKADVKQTPKTAQKNDKRKKNLSVVSLPNYNDLKLSVANSTENADVSKQNGNVRSSVTSLPGETKGKLEIYMTRCRSFGSLLPHVRGDKLKTPSKAPADVESDDSFGGLEDWDLRIIEHYNPRDTSLPRPRKPPQRNQQQVLNDVENLIVSNEEANKPIPPVRRSESLLKRLNREASESANVRKSAEKLDQAGKDNTPGSITPPPSPEAKDVLRPFPRVDLNALPTYDEEGHVEHSSLLKILEDFSIKDKKCPKTIEEEGPIPLIDECVEDIVEEQSASNLPSLTPSLVEFEKTISNTVEEFLNTERTCTSKDLHFTKFNNLSLPQNSTLMKT